MTKAQFDGRLDRIHELERTVETLHVRANEIGCELDGERYRIAELERAAETSRSEHAAALGLATARIRELEGEREELLGLLKVGEAERDLCANALYERDHTAAPARACSYSRDVKCWWHRRRAIVARIEKAAKGGTTP